MVIEVDMEAIRQDNATGEQIKTIIERVERLEEEKAGIQGDIKDVFAEAKANGFDTKVIKRIIRERKRDRDDLANEEAMLDIYKQAIGEA